MPLPTPFGVFEVRAFEQSGGHLYLAMVLGEIGDGDDVLVRLHSECLTGDALGSLRCDCGVQLRLALRLIAAEGRGVLVYATGHEGRGIGLVNKLRAYVAQDEGADTVDANVVLGLPVDSRDYTDAAAVLEQLGVRTVRLLTNNPRKVTGLRAAGATVTDVVPLPTAPHHRNAGYLPPRRRGSATSSPTGIAVPREPAAVETDVMALSAGPAPAGPALRRAQVRPDARRAHRHLDRRRPLDQRRPPNGRSRTRCGRRRRGDGGVGTVLQDDPQLTVRMVAGASPLRIVLDTSCGSPPRPRCSPARRRRR